MEGRGGVCVKGEAGAIISFRDEFHFLSNFFPCPIKYRGILYSSVEHAYQAQKFPPDFVPEFRYGSAGKAKMKAKELKGMNLQRKDWHEVNVGIMRDLLNLKFSTRYLRDRLLATGNAELVEGNWWGDTFWGVCKGIGENMLGRMLMEIRKGINPVSASLPQTLSLPPQPSSEAPTEE